MSIIEVSGLTKTFRTRERAAGLVGSLRVSFNAMVTHSVRGCSRLIDDWNLRKVLTDMISTQARKKCIREVKLLQRKREKVSSISSMSMKY